MVDWGWLPYPPAVLIPYLQMGVVLAHTPRGCCEN